MASQALRLEITDGPAKWDLMISLLDGDKDHRRPVEFTVTNQDTYLVLIQSLQREDGSGECWNFTGSVWGVRSGGRYMPRAMTIRRGYFTTKRRKGDMFVESA